jgi:CopG-like RHH_1 or ribbon-helix-helix domain, RHH_5
MSSRPLLSFRPKAELVAEIKAAASHERRTVSQFIAVLVEDALAARSNGPDDQRSAA